MENSVSTGTEILADNTGKRLNIYPNPFATETKIQLENNGFDTMLVQIYSMDGRLVSSKNIAGNEYIWQGENQNGQKLQSGMYICKVLSNNKLYTGKVIFGK